MATLNRNGSLVHPDLWMQAFSCFIIILISHDLALCAVEGSKLQLIASQPLRPANQQQQQGNTTTSGADAPSYIATGRKISKILNDFFEVSHLNYFCRSEFSSADRTVHLTSLIIVPQKGYDKRVRPNYGGLPVGVNVTMRILSISSVSEVMMDFTADFYFRQTWVDPRLRFTRSGDIQTLYVGAEVSKRIWLPDTFFGNEKLAYFHEATTPNVFLRIDHTGEVYRSIRLTVTSSCPMKLQYFPMDRQQCTIEAESYGYSIKDIIYRWARSTAVERDKTISLPQFDITRTEQKTRIEELSSGTYSRLIAEIHFARRMGYYLIQIYIPSSLIVVISWVSFWLHRNASPARVQLGVTTVLTMTTLMSSTNAALPKISYVKSIDVFLGTCFVMVFAALLEYATVGYLGKRIAMRKAHAQNVLSHAVAMTQRMVAAQNQANLMSSMNLNGMMGNSVLVSAQPSNHHVVIDNNGHNLSSSHNGQQTSQLNSAHPTNNQNADLYRAATLKATGQAAQPNVVEQFLSSAATLPSLMAPKYEKIGPYPARSRVRDSKLGKAKQLDSIFGVRPSSIDKYSRVVFPVCFVCFQLMYWIVYLHISAFLESNGLENK